MNTHVWHFFFLFFWASHHGEVEECQKSSQGAEDRDSGEGWQGELLPVGTLHMLQVELGPGERGERGAAICYA